MKKFIAAISLAITAAIGAVAAPAQAAGTVATTTVISIQPGSTYTFHNGDPIKICTRTETAVVVNEPVRLRVEVKDLSLANPTWVVLWGVDGAANTTTCGIGIIQGSHSDMQVRARTLNSTTVIASTSRTITVHVA